MKKLTLVLGFLLVVFAVPASAVTYGFACLYGVNLASDCTIAKQQITVDVNAHASGVEFLFKNIGPEASNVESLYWGDPGGPAAGVNLDSIVSATGTGVVEFSYPGASPPNPGGSIPWNASLGLNSDADSPVAQKGIGPGESLSVVISLQTGKSYADVINAINAGSLKMAMHVIAFESKGSEWLANTGVVPEPGFYGALALGLAGVYMAIRRRKA